MIMRRPEEKTDEVVGRNPNTLLSDKGNISILLEHQDTDTEACGQLRVRTCTYQQLESDMRAPYDSITRVY